MAKVTPHTIQMEGRQVHVWRGGSGPPLVLVHGGLGDAELHWGAVWEALAEHFWVLAPDLPGFGHSEGLPTVTYTILLEWLASLLQAHHLNEVALAGNSFGGGLARLYAAHFPDQVRRLVLVNGGQIARLPVVARVLLGARMANPLFEWIRRRAYSRQGLEDMIMDPALLTPEFLAKTQTTSFVFVRVMRETGVLPPPSAQTPTAPTLILWGTADRLAPLRRGQEIAREIPGALLREIESAGHLPQLERPQTFVTLVRDFCAP